MLACIIGATGSAISAALAVNSTKALAEAISKKTVLENQVQQLSDEILVSDLENSKSIGGR